MTLSNKQTAALIAGAALLGGTVMGIAGIVSADTTQPGTSTSAPVPANAPWPNFVAHMRGFGRGMMAARGARGTVTAINGTTITLTGANGTTYTIDASQAAIEKISAITSADIKVGDTLGVQGSLSGTTVTAKHIVDGFPQKPAQQ